MGVALEWEPWNWDLWNTPQEPDDDASREVGREKLDEAMGPKRICDTKSQDSHVHVDPRKERKTQGTS